MRAVDTNVLVRLVTGDDSKQAAAAENFVSSGAWVSHLVLAETIWVLATVYDRDPPALAQTVEFLLKHRDLTVQDAEVVVAALVHYRNRPSLGFFRLFGARDRVQGGGTCRWATFDRTFGEARRSRAHRRMNGDKWTAH